ncbi:flagellar hook-associated protein FlgK [Rhizobium oryzicola]|uniref:Flagellar hook-associated protein 1 n=1 Tax=Rhizobium oryzicola TaxID=1232668 RepID=A0ABT8SRJ3_9HYPH|nr:flagellar hook-associated protein FlgK [Rhizobium oryzicola]MDO1581034.1 flagellar hook-associated protein FlgK [Rhizobium oryzicola]
MSLSTALSTAQSIFNNTGIQTSVTSTNISNAQNANYVKRTAVLTTAGNGAQVALTERSQNTSLLRQFVESNSIASGQTRLLSGLQEIRDIMGGNDYENAMSTRLGTLFNKLQSYAGSPSSSTFASSVVSSAQDAVDTLNNTSQEVQNIRTRADAEIKLQVDKLNGLLQQFEAANNQVVGANVTGGDPNNALDTRETLLKQITDIVGVSTVTREHGDMALYTSDGTVLFEKQARTVSFAPTQTYDAKTTGNSIFIDGVVVPTGNGGDTTANGKLQALLQIRDDIAPKFQSQLDEIARGMIVSFAETGPDGTLPAKAGLFTNGVDDTVDTTGTVVAGLAYTISVNKAVKDKPSLLRDGGINDDDGNPATPSAYIVNTKGDAGYSKLLDKYAQNMKAPLTVDPATDIGGTTSLMSLSSNSASWLETLRSTATSANETKSAMQTRAQEAYSSKTGVSLDEELSLLLDIEQSYKAASKLVTTIDEMLKSLLSSVG